jgi:hypothetical protein
MTTLDTSLIEKCYELLAKTQSNVVWEILRQSEPFVEWDHYPQGDVYDKETQGQYYYHAHPKNKNNRWKEHGHFHLFIRKTGIPENILPQMLQPHQEGIKTDDFTHLCAISMNKFGKPLRLFTTNRWVTGETWYSAKAVIQLLPLFSITHAWPSWPTNIWLTQLVQLYQREIATLLQQRDAVIEKWQHENPNANVFEDRNLEITSHLLL